MTSPEGQLPSRYQVLRSVGQGAAGEVFLARDTHLDRQVALKVLRRDRADAAQLERFAREAQVLGRLPHPGLVPVLDLNLEQDPPFLALAWMPGGDLASALLRRGRFPPHEVARIGMRLASALGHLHAHGILHRDVKPENVLLDERDEPCLSDLGLARGLDTEALTRTGHVVGTPYYMAPELIATGEYSPGSDLYGLALVLAELAAGERLKTLAAGGDAAQELAGKAPHAALRKLLRRALRSDPASRLGDAATFEAGLAEVVAEGSAPGATEVRTSASPSRSGRLPTLAVSHEHTPPPRRRLPPVPLGVALALAGLGLWRLASGGPGTSEPPLPAPLPEHPVAAAALREELEDAQAFRWDGGGHRVDAGGRYAFPEALSRFGYRILDDLPVLRRELTSLATRPERSRLAAADRKALEEYDAAWAHLGTPPIFRPFLELAPDPRDAEEAPPPLPTYEGQVFPGGRVPAPTWPPAPRDPVSRGWWRAAVESGLRAHRLHEELREAHARGDLDVGDVHVGMGRIAVFTGQETGALGLLFGGLRMSAAGRRRIDELTLGGLARGRAMLLAGDRLLARLEPEEVMPYVDALVIAFHDAHPFFQGSYLTASPGVLFGGPGERAANRELRARVYEHLAVIRERILTFGDHHDPTPELWREALELAAAEGPPARAARVWVRWLRALSQRNRAAEFREVEEAWRARLRPHLGEREPHYRELLADPPSQEPHQEPPAGG